MSGMSVSTGVDLEDDGDLRTRLLTRAGKDRPRVLLLQGPVGPFFEVLHRHFAASGFDALKINFNGGDWLFGRAPQTINFAGNVDAWSKWIAEFFQRAKPIALVLFGDCRPYHRVAIVAAKQAGVPVWCLEEGYSRPHFITCELNGNNARSPMREVADEAAMAPVVPHTPVEGRLFTAMALHAVFYYTAKLLGTPFFMNNEHHRKRPMLSEAVLWTRCIIRKILYFHANAKLLQHAIEHLDHRYFVVAMQVHDDQQLLRNGRGWTMERLLAASIESFALHAAVDAHLVIKVHPMDRGHRSYRALVRRLARRNSCQSRVHVIDDGSIGLLIRHSLGVLTVNSTSGLLALNHGKPLLALGEALYSDQASAVPAGEEAACLDRFWHEADAPDGSKVAAFVQRLRSQSLVNGSFYLRAWLAPTSALLVQRVWERACLNVVPLTAPGARCNAEAVGGPPKPAIPAVAAVVPAVGGLGVLAGRRQ